MVGRYFKHEPTQLTKSAFCCYNIVIVRSNQIVNVLNWKLISSASIASWGELFLTYACSMVISLLSAFTSILPKKKHQVINQSVPICYLWLKLSRNVRLFLFFSATSVYMDTIPLFSKVFKDWRNETEFDLIFISKRQTWLRLSRHY